MNKQTEKLLITGGIIAVAYFGIINPLLKKIGLKKGKEEKETEEKNKQLLNEQVKTVLKTQKPTKSVEEWKVIADQIYNDLRYTALNDNKADAGYQVTRVKNEADFWILFQQFKKRREYILFLPSGDLMNLQQFIVSNLSKEAIAKINDNYRRKEIKFRF
jgi:hypothetical protein